MVALIGNSRGWIRIVEAVIAIVILAGVLLYVYSSQQTEKVDVSDYVYNLQKKILVEVANNESLREAVLAGNVEYLQEYADSQVPSFFEVKLSICDAAVVCPVDLRLKDVYLEERLISSNLETYSPKVVRVAIWESDN